MQERQKYIQTGPDRRSPAEILECQKMAQRSAGTPSLEVRIDRLNRAIGLVVDHRERWVEALGLDFGRRSAGTSMLADLGAAVTSLKHARGNLRAWSRSQSRTTTPRILGLLGAKARVTYQPKGVVGIMSPWNYPVNLSLSPLAGAFAAGCRALIKPSETVPHTAELLDRLVRENFDESELAVVLGGPEVGAAFSRLPFDHLLFTGAGSVAREVARAAAENLVPTTLELGGKSPVLVGRSADLRLAARRVMAGKTMNAGQTCLAPDYAILPSERVTEFVAEARIAVQAMYPALLGNPDYTAIVNERHFQRLRGYLDDARAKGAEVVELAASGEPAADRVPNLLPPVLVLNPTDEMRVMQDEIFGPILPVTTYRNFEEAIDHVNFRPRPLGLYYFGKDRAEERAVLERTISGGVTVNDVILHVAMEDLPFGGTGPSGMGAYHGIEGFRTFSHAKAVLRQSPLDITSALRPPYGRSFSRIVEGLLRR